MRLGLCVLAVTCLGCPPFLADVDGGTFPSMQFRHAHNDYEHQRPLFDALEQGFDSVEADVWLDGADIGVSHTGAPFRGSLRTLYLDPLAERVARQGFVQAAARPFYLWVDLKQGDLALQERLVSQLSAYEFLTRFTDDGVERAGPVAVILTGVDEAKKALAARAAPRTYQRDSNFYSPSDPPADARWSAYAVPYSGFLTWSGAGQVPERQRQQLQNLVNGAHLLGRKLRIYGCPETKPWWRLAKEVGVDFVGGDDLTGIANIFTEP
jgi:hypothetical protein